MAKVRQIYLELYVYAWKALVSQCQSVASVLPKINLFKIKTGKIEIISIFAKNSPMKPSRAKEFKAGNVIVDTIIYNK